MPWNALLCVRDHGTFFCVKQAKEAASEVFADYHKCSQFTLCVVSENWGLQQPQSLICFPLSGAISSKSLDECQQMLWASLQNKGLIPPFLHLR